MNKIRRLKHLSLATAATLVCQGALAGPGLAVPQGEVWWPHWQARISLQSQLPSASSLLTGPALLVGSSANQRGIQGGALLGDYYFLASPRFGNFRASGGLMVGSAGGVPLSFGGSLGAATPTGSLLQPSSRVGLALTGSVAAPAQGLSAETSDATPYLGLGYTGRLWRDSISLIADLGMISERPTAAASVGKAVFGNQGTNQALREMRLSPVLQLGLRYTF